MALDPYGRRHVPRPRLSSGETAVLGTIRPHGRGWCACDAAGNPIGEHRTRRAAFRAIYYGPRIETPPAYREVWPGFTSRQRLEEVKTGARAAAALEREALERGEGDREVQPGVTRKRGEQRAMAGEYRYTEDTQ